MTLSEPGVESRKGATRLLARFAWLTLAYNIGVILWGAYVRATGSGAGCGNHWPLCNGAVLPRTPQTQTIIEFTHRLTSALALVLVSSLLVWCWRKSSKGDWVRYSSLAALLLLFNEALLGALLVLLEHVGQDRSAGRMLFLCMHFANTLLLLAVLAVTAQWLSKSHRRFSVIKNRVEIAAVVFGLLAIICIGITGSLAALGDTLFPAASLKSSLIQDFSSGNILLRLRFLHPVTAAIGTMYVLWIVLRNAKKERHSSKLIKMLAGVLVGQIGLGILNVLLLAPVWLQLVHLFVAELFWILVVLASANLLFVPVDPRLQQNTTESGATVLQHMF
ncbi:MAG TPA: COX15/CtaA family protein [Candidatus Angelobacter sp.]|nr:COX15/CtaA family protein [Candidatus Angelobacter sp.]